MPGISIYVHRSRTGSNLLSAQALRRIPLILLLLLLATAVPLTAQPVATHSVTDLTGRDVRVPVAPQRVVSLAPGITEMIFSLGREQLLLATVEFSNYPEAARQLPRIGSYIRPDLEKIVALNPDLVLATRDGNPRHLIEQLGRLQIPVYAIDPRNLEQIGVSLVALGKLLRAEPVATSITDTMRDRLGLIDSRVARATHQPLVFFQVDAEPLVSVGDDTFLHELITRAGGRNAAAGGPPYPRFNWEQILRMQPEVVIITSMSGGQSPEFLRRQWLRWPQLQVVQSGRISVVDADLFDRPTQRLVDGLEILAQLIQPELFPPEKQLQPLPPSTNAP